MPITSSDFEKSSRRVGVLLKEFLRFNSHIAYSPDELVEALASKGRNVPTEEVERILLSLEYGGRLESRIVDGMPYYRYKRVLGFMPMKKLR